MRVDVPKELNSPRAAVSFSFLSAVQWLKGRLRSALRNRSEQAPLSHKLAISSENQKYPRAKHVVVFLLTFAFVGVVGIAFSHDANQSVPRFQEFNDPDGSFANLNL